MGRTVDSLQELERLLTQDINKTLRDEVEKVARHTLKENVIEEVYNKYDPKVYERTGGLIQDSNISSQIESVDTLVVHSTREDDGRDIGKIIETGDGYQFNSEISGVPRPFHKITADELREGKAEDAMRRGLKKLGHDVVD